MERTTKVSSVLLPLSPSHPSRPLLSSVPPSTGSPLFGLVFMIDLEAYYEDLDTSDPNPPHAGHSHDHDSHDHSHSHSHSHDAPTSPPKTDNIFKSKSKAEFNAGPKPSDFDMDKLR